MTQTGLIQLRVVSITPSTAHHPNDLTATMLAEGFSGFHGSDCHLRVRRI